MTRSIALALVALLLCGCASIQTVGPVVEVPLGATPRGVQIAAEPPKPGVTAVRLVEGFIQAMADPEADYAVARQYLAADAASEWDPRSGGSVYKGVVTEADGAVSVNGTRTGVLDAHGRFDATSDDFSFDFGVVQVDGEWRIGRPPDGVLVSDYIFERYWSHVTVYFIARSGDHVVPDLIHVPKLLLTPNRVVEAVLAGPSDRIAASVRNAAGPGIELARGGASVDADGTAMVALTGLSASMPTDRRRLLGAQLLWSLTSIPRVTGLRVTNAGELLQLPGQDADGVLQLSSQQGFQLLSRAATSDLFGVSDGVGGRLGPDELFLPMSSDGVAVSEMAVSIDGTLVGFIDARRSGVMMGPLGGRLTVTTPGWTNLRSAQFALGMLWVLGDDERGSTHLMGIDIQGKVSEVDVGDVDGPITDFSITQAGVRVAAILGGGQRLAMASLVGGSEPRLSQWSELPLLASTTMRLQGYLSLDWSGETDLVVVAEGTSDRSVFRARLDGSTVEDLGAPVDDLAQVTALPRPSGDAVVVRSGDGTILRHDPSSRWTRTGAVLQEASFPG